jgi:hypothetical protein
MLSQFFSTAKRTRRGCDLLHPRTRRSEVLRHRALEHQRGSRIFISSMGLGVRYSVLFEEHGALESCLT